MMNPLLATLLASSTLIGSTGWAAPGGDCPDSDHDCFSTGSPGCSDPICCGEVCALDPFCCTTAWDTVCTDLAIAVCKPPPAPLAFAGMPHTPLGNAVLSTNRDGALVVGNIGSSGNDGVRIGLGAAANVALETAWSEFPTSGTLTYVQRSTTDEVVATLTTEFLSSQVKLTPVFANEGNLCTVQLLLEGETVVIVEDLAAAEIIGRGGIYKPPKWKCFWKKGCGFEKCWKGLHSMASPTQVEIVGVGTFLADAIVMTEGGECSGGSIGSLDVLGQDVPDLIIAAEYLESVEGSFWSALAGTTLSGNGGAAEIAPLVKGDPFGVLIAPTAGDSLGKVAPPEFISEWYLLSRLPDAEGTLLFSSTGRAGGIDGVQLGTLEINASETEVVIVADYQPFSSATQRILVFKGGTLVHTVVGNSQPVVGDCPEPGLPWVPDPTGCSKGLVLIDGLPTPCYRPRWPHGLRFTFGNGESAVGDQLAVLAENPTAPLEGLESLSINVSGYPQLAFWTATFPVPTPSACLADLNGDGTVDGADLGIMLGGWGQPGIADLNGDGSVDGADLGTLLGSWGACG